LVHHDRDYLAGLIPVLSAYLDQNLGLALHPGKTRLAHHRDGVAYLGERQKPSGLPPTVSDALVVFPSSTHAIAKSPHW